MYCFQSSCRGKYNSYLRETLCVVGDALYQSYMKFLAMAGSSGVQDYMKVCLKLVTYWNYVLSRIVILEYGIQLESLI